MALECACAAGAFKAAAPLPHSTQKGSRPRAGRAGGLHGAEEHLRGGAGCLWSAPAQLALSKRQLRCRTPHKKGPRPRAGRAEAPHGTAEHLRGGAGWLWSAPAQLALSKRQLRCRTPHHRPPPPFGVRLRSWRLQSGSSAAALHTKKGRALALAALKRPTELQNICVGEQDVSGVRLRSWRLQSGSSAAALHTTDRHPPLECACAAGAFKAAAPLPHSTKMHSTKKRAAPVAWRGPRSPGAVRGARLKPFSAWRRRWSRRCGRPCSRRSP
jgi:hypothetical protein